MVATLTFVAGPVIQANGAEFWWLFEVFGWPASLCFHIDSAPTSILASTWTLWANPFMNFSLQLCNFSYFNSKVT